jgi:hypothetical protein
VSRKDCLPAPPPAGGSLSSPTAGEPQKNAGGGCAPKFEFFIPWGDPQDWTAALDRYLAGPSVEALFLFRIAPALRKMKRTMANHRGVAGGRASADRVGSSVDKLPTGSTAVIW